MVYYLKSTKIFDNENKEIENVGRFGHMKRAEMLVFSLGGGCRKLHNFRSLGQITPNFDKLRYLQANGEERKRKIKIQQI